MSALWNVGATCVGACGSAIGSGSGSGDGGGPTAWNPADANLLSFSNGNLTISASGVGTHICRATKGQASGQYYFEVALSGVGAVGGTGTIFGIATPTVALTGLNSVHSNVNQAFGIYDDGTILFNQNPTGANAGSFTAATVCLAINMINLRGWIRVANGNWNGSGTANPATNTGGIDISAVFTGPISTVPYADLVTGAGALTATANFASAFTYTVPSGFQGGPA
jgi:hypothetical protein